MIWLSPLWLAALGALVVPLVIHLRRRRIGRRIRVGSLRHIVGTATPRARRLQLHDPWRLLLRCGIVAAIALALAGPLFRHSSPRAEYWVLIAPDVLADSRLLADDPLLDSLRHAGTAVRSLSPGFEPTTLGIQTAAERPIPPDAWSLLRDADHRLPPGSSIMVVLRPRVASFRGDRPALGAPVEVRLVGGAQRDSTWLESGWAGPDSATVALGAATRGGLRSPSLTLPTAGDISAAGRSGLSVGGAGDRRWAGLGVDTIRLLQPAPVRFTIAAAANRLADRHYLSAAVAAVSEFYGLRTSVDTAAAPPASGQTGAPGAWLAWLDSSPPPPGGAGSTVLTESGGPSPPPGDIAIAEAPLTDAFGRPLLGEAVEGAARVLTVRGRLNPRWSDLVRQSAFPELLARLWAAPMIGLDGPPRFDPRSVAPGQIRPTPSGPRRTGVAGALPLRSLLLLAAGILFLAERWTVHRPRP